MEQRENQTAVLRKLDIVKMVGKKLKQKSHLFQYIDDYLVIIIIKILQYP